MLEAQGLSKLRDDELSSSLSGNENESDKGQ